MSLGVSENEHSIGRDFLHILFPTNGFGGYLTGQLNRSFPGKKNTSALFKGDGGCHSLLNGRHVTLISITHRDK